ncbi:MAG: hypothetical protein GWO02_12010, partial [Gammaproteobacteria bacterium]|nr:hypothetical protein [Gammaproteobacteria bacterium]
GGIDARDRARDEDWLASLARRMGEHSQSVFTIEGLQPSWLARRKDRLGYALRSRLAAGLILGIAEGLYVGGLGFMGNPFLVDFGRGVAVGILFGILIGLYDWARIEHGMRSTGKPRRGSVPMFMLSLVVYFLAFALPFAWLWRDSADVW